MADFRKVLEIAQEGFHNRDDYPGSQVEPYEYLDDWFEYMKTINDELDRGHTMYEDYFTGVHCETGHYWYVEHLDRWFLHEDIPKDDPEYDGFQNFVTIRTIPEFEAAVDRWAEHLPDGVTFRMVNRFYNKEEPFKYDQVLEVKHGGDEE